MKLTEKPASRAASAMAASVRAFPCAPTSKLTTPSAPNLPVTSARAAALGRYPSACMASSTLARVVASTLSWLLATRETVWEDTPAFAATSAIEGHFRGVRERGALVAFSATADRLLSGPIARAHLVCPRSAMLTQTHRRVKNLVRLCPTP